MSFWYFLEYFLIISSDPSLFLYSLSRILLFSNFSYFFVFFLYLVSLSSSFFIVVRNFIFLFWASFTLFILLLFLGFKTYLYFIFFFSSFCSHFLNAKTLAYQIFLEPYNMVCVSPDKKRKKPYNFNSFLLTNLFFRKKKNIKPTTFNGGSLGSCIDEERCELRYVMRIAQLSESLKFWTHIAPWQQCHGMPGRVSFPNQFKSFFFYIKKKKELGVRVSKHKFFNTVSLNWKRTPSKIPV